MTNKIVWIGLANVAPSNRRQVDFDGAFVNAVCAAASHEDFVSRVRTALGEEDMLLLELNDVEKFDDRARNYEINEDLMSLAESAKTSEDVFFGTFHAYDANDEN